MATTKALRGSGTQKLRSLSLASGRRLIKSSKPAVVLTGFGPFPGVPRNASAELVREVAKIAARRHRDLSFVTEVLPVSWSTAPAFVVDLLSQYRPLVALHFGVSARASEFVIETRAFNSTGDVADQSGACAGPGALIAGDRPQRTVTLPVQRVLEALHTGGFPANTSSDPGRYLCNAVLYHSLRQGARAEPRRKTGFIHIPATLESDAMGKPSNISWDDAVSGALASMEAALRSNATAVS